MYHTSTPTRHHSVLRQLVVDIQSESLSDKRNEYGHLSSGIQTEEEEVDDSHYEHGCCRAVRKSSLPVEFLGISSC